MFATSDDRDRVKAQNQRMANASAERANAL